MIIELKDKIGAATTASTPTLGPGTSVAPETASSDSNIADAVAALTALGYKLPDADKAVRKAISALGDAAKTEAIIRTALNG